MNDWPTLLPSILCTLAILVAPGCLILLAAGIRRAKVLLGSPLVSFAVIGLASLVTGQTGLTGWNIGFLAAFSCLLFALTVGIRAIACRGRLAASFRNQRERLQSNLSDIGAMRICWLAGSVVATSMAAFAMVALAVPSTNSLVQGHDAAFHLSVIRRIIETGCASPFGAGSVMGPANAIYPNAWHALTALVVTTFGTSIPQGVWITVLTLLMFVLPCSTCLLASSLFEIRWGLSFLFAAILPVAASTSAASFASFGPLYANLCGLAILPAAIAYAVLALDRGIGNRKGAIALALAAGILGLGFTHPNTVFTLTLFLLPLFIARCSKTWQRLGLGALFIACWAACFNLSAFSRTVNCLDRIGDDIERATTLVQHFGIAYDSVSALTWLPLLSSCVIVGVGTVAAIGIRKRWNNSWYLVALSLLASLVACSLFPTNWFSKIATGFWYRDYFRLAVMFGMFTLIAFAAVPELALARALSATPTPARHARRPAGKLRGLTVACGLACAVALLALAALGLRSHASDFREETVAAESDGAVALTQQRAEFCEDVASIVGDATVLNSHNDASVWLYPLYGVDALAKGRPANQMGNMDEDHRLLVTSIDRYGIDNEEGAAVRNAAERLGVEYLVQMNLGPDSTIEFGEGNAIGYTDHDAENEVSGSTPGFDLVLEQNGMRLWKLS